MPHTLKQKVQAFFKSHKIDITKSHFLLACSGGIDSMVLTHLLQVLKVQFSLVHCNFNLRNSESNADQKFVKNVAKENHIPFFTKSFNTKAFAQKHGISTQMAARDLRYTFFNQLITENNFHYLLTAHHLDDSLETILINLGRGTGISGLKGIAPIQHNIVRPLIEISRDEIVAYAKDYNITWREDSSNASDHYQRNFLRHHVVPKLKEAFPNFKERFTTTQSHLNADIKLYQKLFQDFLSNNLVKSADEIKLPIKTLKNYKSTSSILHLWLSTYGNFDIVAITKSLDSESGRVFESETHTLLRDREYLILQKKSQHTDTYQINKTDNQISIPIGMAFNCVDDNTFEVSKNNTIAQLDFEKLEFPLHLRHWKKGDKFVPLGLTGFKKLSDFFIDKKINRFEKDNIWLLCSGQDIVWVVGHRIDDRYKITDKTKRTYIAQLFEINPHDE